MADRVVDLNAEAVRSYGKNTFKLKPFEHITTVNTGDLVPLFATAQIQPGDSWNITTSILARLNTSKYPTIARGEIVYMWVYVPHVQIWDHWNELMGENTESAWISQTTYSVPQIEIPQGTPVLSCTLLDYEGAAVAQDEYEMSALIHRAYLWACDQIARDQNIEAPFAPATDDNNIVYDPTDFTKGGVPYKINRKADWASTALPEPQKGPDVLLPLGTRAPIKSFSPSNLPPSEYRQSTYLFNIDGSVAAGTVNRTLGNGTDGHLNTFNVQNTNAMTVTNLAQYADLSSATSANIIAVRKAVITQHIFERDARSGTRAPEMLWARWGVEVDPLELGRPRILTMGSFTIEFHQVVQNSESTNTSKQGTLTAFGYTNNREENGTFSFKYHGTLMCLVAIRFEHKYQQGMREEFFKKDRWDFWHPEYAGLGDQPIYTRNLYATGGASGTINAKTIFGYGVRGWEYQNYPSMVTGQAKSQYNGTVASGATIDFTHMADIYNSEPTLSSTWMKENADNVDRTIFVQSSITQQWLIDFIAEFTVTTTMPLYSIPGIDRI